jgi:hypothetical protein
MNSNLKNSLFILKLGVLAVLVMWNVDKYVNPEHTAGVFNRFYLVSSLNLNMSYIIGGLQSIVLLMFTFGMYKKFSYGLVFVMHLISTLSTWEMYLDPWGPRNLLFFAAWPMLAATWVLFKHRDEDTVLNLGKKA